MQSGQRSIEERQRIARMTEYERIEAGLWRLARGRVIRIEDMPEIHLKRAIAKELTYGDNKYSPLWVKRMREEFEKNYRQDHWAAEFIVMIEGETRPTTLYYTPLYDFWFDELRIYNYKVVAWTPLPEPCNVE